jgi:hypothetical protein
MKTLSERLRNPAQKWEHLASAALCAANAIDTLLAALEATAADKQDAERYRYLRSRPESVEPNRIDVVYWSALDESANEGEALRGDALDDAVDSARTKGAA